MMTLLPLQQQPKREQHARLTSGRCLTGSLPSPPLLRIARRRLHILNQRLLSRLLLSPCCSVGVVRGAVPVAAALLAAGKGFGVEPFAVLAVSLLVSKALCSNAFSGNKADDDPVSSR